MVLILNINIVKVCLFSTFFVIKFALRVYFAIDLPKEKVNVVSAYRTTMKH
jgi:hypothetical protein